MFRLYIVSVCNHTIRYETIKQKEKRQTKKTAKEGNRKRKTGTYMVDTKMFIVLPKVIVLFSRVPYQNNLILYEYEQTINNLQRTYTKPSNAGLQQTNNFLSKKIFKSFYE